MAPKYTELLEPYVNDWYFRIKQRKNYSFEGLLNEKY